MARVPVLDSNVQQTALPKVRQSPEAPIEAFGGMQAGALQARQTAVANVVGGVADIYEQEKKKADDARSKELYAQILHEKNDILYNPKSGLLNKREKDAVNVSEEGSLEFKKRLDELGKDLSGDLRTMYEGMRLKEGGELEQNLTRHAFSENLAYQKSSTLAAVGASQNDAVLNYANRGKVDESIATQAGALTSYLSQAGKSKDEIDLEVAKAASDTYAKVIQRMITLEDPKAQGYYASVKDKIGIGDTKNAIEKALEEGTLRSESQRRVDDILTKATSEKEALAMVKDTVKDNAKLRDEMTTRVTQEFNRQAQARDGAQKDLYYKALDQMKGKSGPIKDRIDPNTWATLDLEKRAALSKFDGVQTNDDAAWLEFLDLSSGQQAGMDLATFQTRYWSKFDDAHRTRAESMWSEASRSSENNPKLTSMMGAQEQLKTAVTATKLYPPDLKDWSDTQKTEYAQLEQVYQQKLSDFEVGLGSKRTATPLERQKIVDELIMNQVYINDGWFKDSKKPAGQLTSEQKEIAYVPYAEVPAVEIESLQREYARLHNNKPMRRPLIERAYAAAKMGDKALLNKILGSE